MVAHRFFNYFGRSLAACFSVAALIAAEHHGLVKSNGLPVPGATVTAAQGDKKFVTTTDDRGAYSFADLPDGVWTISVEILGFSKLTRDVGVMPDAPSPTWDLKVLKLDELQAQLAASKQSATTPSAPTRNPNSAPAPSNPGSTQASNSPGQTNRPAGQNGGRGARGGTANPSLRQALAQNGGAGANGFQRLDVNASENQNGAEAGLNTDTGLPAGADLGQSSSDAMVVGGSVSSMLGMPQTNDWNFGGRGGMDMGGFGPGGLDGAGPMGPGGFPQIAGAGPGGGPGGGGPGGGRGGMMAGGGPGGFGGPRGGMGGMGAGRGGRGGRGGPGRNANSFGNGRRNPRSQYNGNIMLNLDNSIWDARQFSVNGAEQAKPAYAKFTAGFSLGGPIKIPHLFDDSGHRGTFQISYNLNRSRSATNLTGEVPTAAERTGDFSGAVNPSTGMPIIVYDPSTGQPFPNNVIPTNRLNPTALALLNFYPLPNFAGNIRQNYETATTSISNTDNLTIRLNHTINPKNQINGSVGYQRAASQTPNFFRFVDANHSSGINTSAGWTYHFTTRVISNLRYTFSRQTAQLTPYFSTFGDNVSAQAGITGNYQNPLYYGPPTLSFTNFNSLSDGNPSLNRNQTSAVGDSIIWIHGTHNMTFGGDVRRQQFNPMSQQNARGTFTFNGQATAAPGSVSANSSGYDFADFLLGVPDQEGLAYGNADKYFRTGWFDLYANDDWRLSTKFTLNFGVRWDYSEPFTELYGRLVNLNIAPGFSAATPVCAASFTGCVAASSVGLPSSLLEPNKHNFAPRLGFAFRPSVKHSMVIRGGYGIYWNTSFYQSIVNQMAQQAPLSNSYTVSNLTTPLSIQTFLPASAVPNSNGFTNTFAIDPTFHNGYSQNWQLAIQQNLKGNLVLTTTYVGIKGTGLPQEFIPNSVPIGVSPTGLPTGFNYETSGGNSSYQAGMAQLQRRFRSGLAANLLYTYSKLISDGMLGGRGQGTSVVAQNWRDLAAERALDPNDHRHVLNAMMQYSTGQGLRGGALMKGWKSVVLKDWTFTTNITLSSGAPFTPVTTVLTRGSGLTPTIRPDVIAPVYPATPGYGFNIDAFAQAPAGEFGDAGRDIITGPTQFSLNGSAGRTFRIGERKNLDLTFRATNLLNHVNFSSYYLTLNSAQFGLINPNSVNAMRSFTATLRFHF
jgi:hypothetical protein